MNAIEKFEVTGMTCNHCVMKVEKAIKAIDGVKSASVDLNLKQAVVEYDSSKADTVKIVSTIEKSGYQGKKI
ncbi:MAG: copper ion binding protein [Spirochaetia bacterium]|nr:copper ion binding protein [Spirochaetia bacterium]